jgi:hypothetical protein
MTHLAYLPAGYSAEQILYIPPLALSRENQYHPSNIAVYPVRKFQQLQNLASGNIQSTNFLSTNYNERSRWVEAQCISLCIL